MTIIDPSIGFPIMLASCATLFVCLSCFFRICCVKKDVTASNDPNIPYHQHDPNYNHNFMFERRSPSSTNTSIESEIEGGGDVPADFYNSQVYTSNYATVNEKNSESDSPPKYELFLVKYPSDAQNGPKPATNQNQHSRTGTNQYHQQDCTGSLESSICSLESNESFKSDDRALPKERQTSENKAGDEQPPKFDEIYHTKLPLDDLGSGNQNQNLQFFLVY